MSRPKGPLTAIERAARLKGNRQSAIVRAVKDPEDDFPEEIIEAAPNLSADGYMDPEVRAAIHRYDSIVGEPTDWTSVKAREQAAREIVQNKEAQLRLQRERGRLVDRRHVMNASRGMRDAIRNALASLPDAVVDRLEDMGVDMKGKLREIVNQEIVRAFDAAKKAAAPYGT